MRLGTQHHPFEKINPSTLAGAGAGLVSSVVTCPLDVIKTRLQAQRQGRGVTGYRGVWGIVGDVWKRDGVRGYYRGLGPTILGYIPTWAIYFSVYDGIKGHFGETYHPRSNDGEPHLSQRESMAMHLSAAMVAGLTSTVLTSPLWVIKTRVMTQPVEETRYRHTIDAALKIYRQEGIAAFYRGLIPSLIGVSHVAVQFPLYEELKIIFAERRHHPITGLDATTIFVCSSISKMTAAIVTYPHEVVRTRLQIEYYNTPKGAKVSHPLSFASILDTTKMIIHENGWRGLYRGLSVNLARTVPNSAITLWTYERIMDHLTRPQR